MSIFKREDFFDQRNITYVIYQCAASRLFLTVYLKAPRKLCRNKAFLNIFTYKYLRGLQMSTRNICFFFFFFVFFFLEGGGGGGEVGGWGVGGGWRNE